VNGPASDEMWESEGLPYRLGRSGTIHRAGCPWMAETTPMSEQDAAVRLTQAGASLCGHCDPRITPAGPTPRERQEALYAASTMGRFRTRFGTRLTTRQAHEALLDLADRLGDQAVSAAVQRAAALPPGTGIVRARGAEGWE
jgi:hypothetical protein